MNIWHRRSRCPGLRASAGDVLRHRDADASPATVIIPIRDSRRYDSPCGAPSSRGAWLRALGVGRLTLYQILERHRQRPVARGEFAEQIAIQIIHLRANENSDPSPVPPDAAVANDGKDLSRVGIENDILGKDEILNHGFASKTMGWRQRLWLHDDSASTLKTRT